MTIQTTFIRLFYYLAGASLLAFSTALLIVNWTNADVIQPHEPLFMMSIRNLYWAVAALASFVALACLFGK
jgi:hypothetical protein